MRKLLFVMGLVLAFVSCGDDDEASKTIVTDTETIIGQWVADENYTDISSMEFTKNGVYYYILKNSSDIFVGSYSYRKNVLYLTLKDIDGTELTDEVDCRISGDKMIYNKEAYYTRYK